jgi:hypothetical protein
MTMQEINKPHGEIKASPSLLRVLSSVKWGAETKGPRVIFKSADLSAAEKIHLLYMLGKAKSENYSMEDARDLFAVMAEFEAADFETGGVW